MSRVRPILDFLGLRRSIVGMLLLAVLLGVGERTAERFLPLYLDALGGGALAIGLLGGLTNLLSALYSLPGGYLSDRLGPRNALLLFNGLSMAGFLLAAVAPSWQVVILAAVLFLSWSAISQPATMALVVDVLPDGKRTMGVSMHSLVRRVPMALGPLLGGWLIDEWGTVRGMRVGFVAALLLAGLAAFVQWRLIQPGRHTASDLPPFGSLLADPLALLRQMSPPLRSLLLSDILVRFCEQIPYAFVVMWCMKSIAAPVSAVQFGVLTAIEMMTAMLVYVPVAWMAERAGKKPFVLLTFAFFTLFPLALLLSQSFWPLVIAFVIRGLKEFGEAVRKALILDLADAERPATVFGYYYLVRDLIVTLAAFGGAALWAISPTANLLTACAVGAAGTVWFAFYGAEASGARQTHARTQE